ncbi:MAG: phosphotransferase family protein [Actinomycetia bacterium]|nr:phosphotransferase family protein [Actinomycetes bacterium]
MTTANDPKMRAAKLSCWSGAVDPEPIPGGLTNTNFLVRDRGRSYFVRIGEDDPFHNILRFNELAASRAAQAVGISPAVIHSQEGVIVTDFIEGRTLASDDVRDQKTLARIVPLIQTCHRDIPTNLRGPVSMFWVFHVIRDYTATVCQANQEAISEMDMFLAKAANLERSVGKTNIVFGHNDLLAANIIDDGDRLWLVDWDYAGFNSPLFDLAGLASNSELGADAEMHLLTAYYGQDPDRDLLTRFHAMKCASLLRETLWSMVSEIHSTLDVDFAAYTRQNLARFDREYEELERTT